MSVSGRFWKQFSSPFRGRRESRTQMGVLSWPYKAVGYIYLGACSLHCWEDWALDRLTKEHFIWDVWECGSKLNTNNMAKVCNKQSVWYSLGRPLVLGNVWCVWILEMTAQQCDGNVLVRFDGNTWCLNCYYKSQKSLRDLKWPAKTHFLKCWTVIFDVDEGGKGCDEATCRKGAPQKPPYLRLWLSFLPVQVSPEHL